VIPTGKTASELVDNGYVQVTDRARLEELGVPIYVAATKSAGVIFSHVTLAPGWAVMLVRQWPIHEVYDSCLRKVIRAAILAGPERGSEFVHAALSAAQLGDAEAVYRLLGDET
jgi:hypothetical protein